jgi:hypothetical protein
MSQATDRRQTISQETVRPRRDYEEALRSLGLLFDDEQLQDVMLLERDTGFLVTALAPAEGPLADDPQSRYRFAEEQLSDDDIVAASVRGASQRGTRHRANRNELAFRLIGRYVNAEAGSRILIVDQGDSFLLRMLVDADADMPHRFVTISSGDLERMHEEALAARGGPGGIR